MANPPLSDTWERGSPYEQYIGRWSRQVAPAFLAWLAMPAGRAGWTWVAGPARCAPPSSMQRRRRPSLGSSPRPASVNSPPVRRRAGDAPGGDAASLPLAQGAVDVTVSGLVLNFIADLPAALAEMRRVTRPGGTVAAYVWDYAGRMELIRAFWDAAANWIPRRPGCDEGARFPLCDPGALVQQFGQAGLADCRTTAIDIATHFASFDAYWAPFLGGQGPAPAYAMSLPETGRERLREHLRARLPVQPDGTLQLTARAWAIAGTSGAGGSTGAH